MSRKVIFQSQDDLQRHAGQDITTTDWLVVDQSRIQLFADATGDQQWIHTDPVRAKAESPYGTTVAHGFLTLSLLAEFLQSSIDCKGARMGVNYGLNKVRFPAPVRSGDRIRCHVRLEAVEPLPQQTVQMTWTATIEIDGGDKPACVAEMLSRWYF
ncbi:MAG TPA: MaoC family dehydratase [Candidatus Aquabacterium excrementipullorum]|nr:MaoC family dehydratase [Candidatus Aquabacterium excrementipullorum]